MSDKTIYPDPNDMDSFSEEKSGTSINYSRILSRVIKYWYIIIVFLVGALAVAYMINRYSTPVYPIAASIIIKESEENAGAKFLYNNALVNPYRNFYNELFILKSYPLLQQVIEELNFTVSYYREGSFKTTEVYDRNFPIRLHVLPGGNPWGRTLGFYIKDENTFSLEYLSDDTKVRGTKFDNLSFNDTISVNGYKFYAEKMRSFGDEFNKRFYVIRFHNPLMLAKQYSNKLQAGWAQQGASVVSLNINGSVPEKEVAFLEKFIEKYQEYDVNKKNLVATKSLEFLDEQIRLIQDSLSYFENAILQFKIDNLAVNVNSEMSRLYEELENFESQKIKQILQENYFEYLLAYLKGENNYEQVVTPSSVGITDDMLVRLINELAELQAEISVYGKMENNPLYLQKKQKVNLLRQSIIEAIHNYRRTDKINTSFIDDQISVLEKELRKLPAMEQRLLTINRNYSLREKLYTFLLQKRAEAGISKASTTSDIVVVNPPMIAGGAITPKPLQNYTIAAGVGLVIPFLLFLLMELLDQKIQSREDIEMITSIPFVGGIGHNKMESNLVVYKKPMSSVAEGFRALRSNLNYFTEGKEKKVFLVTSSISGEGKTFTTINLGSVLSISNKKTLIVGADLRKPRLYDDFGLTNDRGLSNYLSHMSTFDEVLQSTGIENLDLISGGPVPPNPSELIMGDKMNELIREAKERYDFIIIDTPPIALVTDAFIISKFADHTIFLVRQNYTPKMVLRTAQELYAAGKINKISVLFNDIKKVGPGYGMGYGYGYGYGGYGIGKKIGGMGYYSEE